ncbi:DUF2631 domain-containing protein [Skermania sp. ID1734]|uniref:DUF2631 domain-containing protein n=1 Tax=Skermania sp. ID1734 TaxID=2597516 RepID=UPI0011813E6C|nr:DUF2631 domain-containing protein [Skermania sp. ID1734]TSD93534.1 DUF2631 domain-containing protein [Skermania sp. ID1734]
MAGKEIDPITEAEVPSARWGWSGESRKSYYAGGIIVALILIAMLVSFGSRSGNVGNVYLASFAAAIFAILIRGAIIRRKER